MEGRDETMGVYQAVLLPWQYVRPVHHTTTYPSG